MFAGLPACMRCSRQLANLKQIHYFKVWIIFKNVFHAESVRIGTSGAEKELVSFQTPELLL